jgi:DNA-binding CsgD family transcriptional regulator
MAEWGRGRVAEAIDALESARPFVVELGNPHLRAMFWWMESEVEFQRGELEQAGSLADRAAAALVTATFAGPITARVRVDHLRSVEAPNLGELASRAELSRRSNDWMAAGLYDSARLTHLLRVEPLQALSLSAWLVENTTGVLAQQDCVIHAHHALAAVGVGQDDVALASAAAAEQQSALADSVMALPFTNLVKALVLSSRAEHLAAATAACEAIRCSIDHGMQVFVHLGLDVLALVAEGSGDHIEAARLHGAAVAECERLGIRQTFAPFDRRCAESVERARAALGSEAFDDACVAGAKLSMEEAVAYALRARGERRRPTTGWDSLTPTELQVVDLVRVGRTNRQVAEQLLMGVETVKTHLAHVFTKLGISNRSQLTALATERAAPSRT